MSCTGFSAPGIDYGLVRDLDLPVSARRVHIGFMGCCAAFPALSTARSITLAEPDAVVLVVCVEICPLHLKVGEDVDAIVASSLFADGCAAMIVSARQPRGGAVVLELDALKTCLTSTGEQDLTWRVGDNGFEMVLSTKVPKIIEAEVSAALTPLAATLERMTTSSGGSCGPLGDSPWGPSHPGSCREGVGAASPNSLRRRARSCGGSATCRAPPCPSCMKSILDDATVRDGERLCALAFGPGLDRRERA